MSLHPSLRRLVPLFVCLTFAGFLATSAAAEPNPVPLPEHEFIRGVPDQRVPLAPGTEKTTIIDLVAPYENLGDFHGQTPAVIVEDAGKTAVVEPEIIGHALHLRWKKLGKSQITLRIEHPAGSPAVGEHIYHERIQLEAWQPDYWMMFFSVLGGLGVFLLGMRFMSDGLQMVAGPSLRTLIATVTDNRFTAVLVGFVVTFLIQSSSVTTVMVVGFVNSQIMTLAQGIGVIMGANIGTTVTGWILTLNIGKYGLPIIGAAGLVYLFAKNERPRFLAMATLGLGFVFFGLELMSSGFTPLREVREFYEWMEKFSADTYWGVLLCAAVGCALTLIVQSSSATLGITISLAAIGVIQFETAVALVLGENVGTTITAILASIGSSTNARRAAYFHVCFNLIGVFWVTLIFRGIFLPLIVYIVGTDPTTGMINDPKVGIALGHTLFNIANTIVFLPFTRVAAKLLIRFVPESADDKQEKSPLTTLGIRRLETPAMAVERSRVEVLRMGESCMQLSEKVLRVVASETKPEQLLIDSAFHDEEMLDTLQDEIIEYTAGLLSGNISHDIGDAAHLQLRMADELESISDYLITILKSNLKMRKDGLAFPEPQRTEVLELHAAIKDYLAMVVQFYSARRTSYGDLMTEVHAQGRSFVRRAKGIRDLFIKRMSDEKFDPQVVIAFNTQLNAYRRVREHAQNVAEAIVGIK